jgi:hypothetical protein
LKYIIVDFKHELPDNGQRYGLVLYRGTKVAVTRNNHRSRIEVNESGLYLCKNIDPDYKFPLFSRKISGDSREIIDFYTVEVIKKVKERTKDGIKSIIFSGIEAPELFQKLLSDYNLLIYHDIRKRTCRVYSNDQEGLQRLCKVFRNTWKSVKKSGFIMSDLELEEFQNLCFQYFYPREEILKSTLN